MNKRSLRRLLYILMVFVLIFSFAACGEGTKDKEDDGKEGNHGGLIWDDDNNDGKEDDGKDAAGTINVSKNIDFSSVTQDGDYTNFNVVLESGKTIRFQGKNVTVSEKGITMEPGAFLVSLDYIGEISLVECNADIEENGLEYGIAYADAPSVDNMTDLQAAFAWGIAVKKELWASMPMGQSGFLAVKMSDNNEKSVNLTNLLIHCNPDAKQVLFSELDPASEAIELLKGYPTWWNGYEEQPINPGGDVTPGDTNENLILLDVMKNIDFSSVKKNGDVTSFNVITESGKQVRFQGAGITVSESGITMKTEGYLVSLDYIGEISHFAIDSEKTGQYHYGIVFADAPSVNSPKDLQVALLWSGEMGVGEYQYVYTKQSGFFAMEPYFANKEDLSITKLEIYYDDTVQQVLYSQLEPTGNTYRELALYTTAWSGNTEEQKAVLDFGKEGVVWDVIASIDPASVKQDGVFINFTAKTPAGKTAHFQGIGITVTKNQFIMEPGSKLFLLDHVGKVLGTKITSKRDGNAIDVGVGYSNKASVDSMTKLKAGFSGAGIEFEKTMVWNVDHYNASFLGVKVPSTQTESMELEELLINYDPNKKQVLYSELSASSDALQLVTNANIDWTNPKNLRYGPDVETLAKMKLEEAGTLKCDIIAGIDRSSIKVKGSTTFFNSVMSDGTVVRFEAENIDITDEGITIRPNSKVTSLDAVGKIFAYTAHVKDGEKYTDGNAAFNFSYAYTYSAKKTSVDKASQIHSHPFAGMVAMHDNDRLLSAMVYEPNFICFEGNSYYDGNIVVTSIEVIYNPAEKVTAMVDVDLSLDFTTAYLEGELYNQNMEGMADASAGVYNFYLLLKPDTPCSYIGESDCIWFVPSEFYKVGSLRDASGKILDKATAKVAKGTTLDITVGDYDLNLELDVIERYAGAQTMNELVPYGFPDALGVNNTLVIPVAWADQKANANDETLALYRKNIGRVMDANGNITDYSDSKDAEFSLSEYFDIASYGKLTVNSFMTDWYYSDKNFADVELNAPDKAYGDEILEWVKKTYPNLDWSKFDQDGNGYVDSIVIINSGVSQRDGYNIISFGGAIHYRHSYYGDYAGTPDNPNANTYVTINDNFLKKEGADTLIHEFTHNFGIIDYYDVTYSGINAVGHYDMQSDNKGDWNAYSKLAVGWMEPTVVEGLKSGESKEFTIGSLALTNDVIIIPTAGAKYDGPFSEYIMIDLLSADGVNKYDAKEFDLDNVTGIRISHVNANMEKRTMEIESKTNPGQIDVYDIGTVHVANDYKDDGLGRYNIEVIQSGKKNTFTNKNSDDNTLSAEDLFYKGDKFTVEGYKEFFYNGLMDDGSKFGYTVEIVSIGKDANGNPTATVRVTAQ